MAGKCDLFNLGSVGIDLTKSVVHAEDGSLRSAQNAVPDNRGEAGGVAKRDGLVAVNSTTAGGSVLGAIHTPLPSIRTQYLWQAGSDGSYFTSTGIFATTTEVNPTNGSTSYQMRPRRVSSGGGPLSTLLQDSGGSVSNAAWVGRPSTVWNGKAVFANDRWNYDFSQVPLTMFDGTIYREFAQLPINPDVGTAPIAIVSLLTEGSYIYAAAYDVGTAFASHKGCVYQIEPVTGTMTRLGATFPTGYVPSSLAWYLGRLWAGTYSEDRTASGRVYWIRPGIDTAWTLDHTTTAGQGEILDLVVYKGLLYAATNGSSGNAALVLARTPLGVWSTSLTGNATSLQQRFMSLKTYGEHLYASYSNSTALTARISRFDNSSWSTVKDSPSALQAWMLHTDGATLFLVDQLGNSDNNILFSSTNGTAYTDRSSVLVIAGGSSQALGTSFATLFT